MAGTIRTTCGYCAVGCHIEATVGDDGSVKLRGMPGSPVNNGLLCPKGMTSAQPFLSSRRVPHPFVRDQRFGPTRQISMDEAINTFVTRLKSVERRYGEGSTAFYSTGQLTTEDFAILGAVGRIGMKMEGDGNTRLCMASAVVGLKQSFGFDVPPYSLTDLEESDCVVLVGSNPPLTQPVLWARYQKAAQQDRDLIVLDPRQSEVAQAATLYLPLKPKSDLALLYIVANTLIQRGWIAQDYIDAHTSGFDSFKKGVAPFTLSRSQELCGLESRLLARMVETIHRRKRVSFWWTLGVNQSFEGVRTSTTLVALALMTGNIGRPGTGPNSITGQCNAMGSRLHSATTSLFGARDFTIPEHRQQVAAWLGIAEERIPRRPTLAIDEIINQIDQGKIKFLWVLATNPVHSFVDIARLKRVLGKLDTLVLQDVYHDTITADYADLFLPAAGFMEKDGSFISMERRISAVNKVLEPPGEALSDFEICHRLAQEYGCADVIKGSNSLFKKPLNIIDCNLKYLILQRINNLEDMREAATCS